MERRILDRPSRFARTDRRFEHIVPPDTHPTIRQNGSALRSSSIEVRRSDGGFLGSWICSDLVRDPCVSGTANTQHRGDNRVAGQGPRCAGRELYNNFRTAFLADGPKDETPEEAERWFVVPT